MKIEYTIKSAKDKLAIDATKSHRPIPTNDDGSPKFTDEEWMTEAAKLDLKDKIITYKKLLIEQDLEEENLFN